MSNKGPIELINDLVQNTEDLALLTNRVQEQLSASYQNAYEKQGQKKGKRTDEVDEAEILQTFVNSVKKIKLSEPEVTLEKKQAILSAFEKMMRKKIPNMSGNLARIQFPTEPEEFAAILTEIKKATVLGQANKKFIEWEAEKPPEQRQEKNRRLIKMMLDYAKNQGIAEGGVAIMFLTNSI